MSIARSLVALVFTPTLALTDEPPPPLEPPVAPTEPPPAPPRPRVPTAELMTRSARTAAQHGDCKTMRYLGDRVRSADADYYNAVFANDPAIANCREGGPAPAEAPKGPAELGGTNEIGIGGGFWSFPGEEGTLYT